MKYFLISDNIDTLTGMRLVGIDGVIVSTAEETEKALDTAIKDKSIGIILITEKLKKLCQAKVADILFNYASPLIVDIPNREDNKESRNTLSQFISEAIGIKLDV